MTERVKPATWIEGIRTRKVVEDQIRQAERQIRILFDPQLGGDQTTVVLSEVYRLFRDQMRAPRRPDRFSISDPRNPRNQPEIDGLVTPDALLPRGINQVQNGGRIATGSLVALFGPNTQFVEYRLYGRFSGTPREGYTVYTPIRPPLLTHGEIYSRQTPAVRLGLLLATVRAIYERANPQIFSKT